MAAKLAGCALVAVAFAPGSAVRSRREESNATAGCKGESLFTTVQDFVNGKIAERIGNSETHQFNLVSFEKEINLLRCSGGLTMTTDLSVSKLSTGTMDDLQCVNEQCVDGRLFCKKALYDIDIGIEFGTIGVSGTNAIDLDVCLVGAGKDLAMDFAIQTPSVNIKVQIEETSRGIGKLPEFKFKQVYGLDFQMGAIEKTGESSSESFDCKLNQLPHFFKIQEKVEGWCEQAVEWTAKKVTSAILGTTTDLFMGLIDVVFRRGDSAPAARRAGKKSKGAAKGKRSALAEKEAKGGKKSKGKKAKGGKKAQAKADC